MSAVLGLEALLRADRLGVLGLDAEELQSQPGVMRTRLAKPSEGTHLVLHGLERDLDHFG